MQTQIRQNDNLQQFLTCGVHLSLAICFFPNSQPPCCLHVSSLAQAYVPWPPHTAGCRASHGRRLRPPPAIVVDHCWLPDIPWSPTSSRRVVLVASCTDLQVTDRSTYVKEKLRYAFSSKLSARVSFYCIAGKYQDSSGGGERKN